MKEECGIACGACDALMAMQDLACTACGSGLSLAWQLEAEEIMEQAKTYVCKGCATNVPFGHRFCGSCGAELPAPVQQAETSWFSSMQAPGAARLVLLRGGRGREGETFVVHQGAAEQWVGRGEVQLRFADDRTLELRHAQLVADAERLVVREHASRNGIYVRIREPMPVEVGTWFICGEQVLRIEEPPLVDGARRRSDGTYCYASPMWTSSFRIAQMLADEDVGMAFCARNHRVDIGRAESDMNFPDDVFMSTQHASVERTPDGRLMIRDRGSKNGTFLRMRGEVVLQDGDSFFAGRQLFKVER